MKRLTLLILASFLTALSSRADVIFHDLFPYNNGPIEVTGTNLDGSTNWFNHSGNIDNYVTNHQLEVGTTTAYLGVTTTRSGDIHRSFATAPGSPYTNVQQVLYASFVVTFTNLPMTNGQYFAHFLYGTTGFEGKLWALQGNAGAAAPGNFTGLPNTFRLGVSAAGSTVASKVFPMDLALNTPYQVVLGYNPTANASADGILLYGDTITLWINPVSPADFSVVSADAFSPAATAIASAFAFRQASSFGGFLDVSNLVVATTFPEAATNVLSTNAVTPQIVYQPTAITSNFVGASITLSAVANGQELGGQTYQWQIATTTNGLGQPVAPSNVTNPSGNTNVLTIDNGSAQVSDTGYYTLVVTTPYGLSTTSSVVKVVVSAAPVPPVFITQPVSKTAYAGQNVIFSTTVSSPGNINYQWFSNNVSIAGANASTYELDNVVPSYSASYRVGVTNDVVVQGILSTNAVLTVINPPTVTIAYLRSLIDHTTFASTNVPASIPYQVTGTVTTFTNLTTGNTSAYYLQDATAGINIFVTQAGAPLFRPAQGDVVTFVGVLSTYTASTAGLELDADTTAGTLYPYTSFTDTGLTAALPAARVIPFTVTNDFGYLYVATNLMESRVTLNNVYFGTNAANTLSTTANVTVTVTNAAGVPFALEFYDLDLDTAGQTLPAFATSVTGVLIGSLPNVFLAVTKFSDIVVPAPTLGVVQSGNSLTFSWTDTSYNLQSQTNSAATGLSNTGWFDYPDTSNPAIITIDPANPTVFYRLNKP